MISAIIKGLTLGVLLSISVGPVIFSIIKQSINNGHKGGYAFIAGVSASDVALVLVCNFFTTFFQSVMNSEKLIGVVGSLFLVGMGIYFFFFKKVHMDQEGKAVIRTFRKRDYLAIFSSGFLMNMLNPSVFLFWFIVSGTIMADSKTTLHPTEYRMTVFLTCLMFNLGADILKVLLANKIRPRLNSKNIHIINRLSGLIFMGFGIALIVGILFYGDKIHS